MRAGLLRAVAAMDGLNVGALLLLSPRHGFAAAAGYAPALVGVVLALRDPGRRRLARALAVAGLLPNTVGSFLVAEPDRRSRALALYVGVGGALLGVGYLAALRAPRTRRFSGSQPSRASAPGVGA